MSLVDDMKWFKDQFGAKINSDIAGTPFTLDLLTSIAVQETGYIWSVLYDDNGLTVEEILKNCVGDTLDAAQGREVFPLDKDDLLSVPKGNEMFNIAHDALISVAEATKILEYENDASDPDAFCHGFGIFQYDIQFFQDDPDFFLKKFWYNFDECLKLALEELDAALNRTYGSATTLTDDEMVYVAIAYNQGSVNPDGDFRQGHYNKDEDKYYGEYIWEYLQLSKTT